MSHFDLNKAMCGAADEEEAIAERERLLSFHFHITQVIHLLTILKRGDFLRGFAGNHGYGCSGGECQSHTRAAREICYSLSTSTDP